MTPIPTNSAGNTTTYIPSRDVEHPMWSDPTYIIDKARLVDWLEQAVNAPFQRLGEDEFQDYSSICELAAYLIGNKASAEYHESQPDLPTEELSPFVILNDGSRELKTLCQKIGISEQSYWFLDQAWMKRCIILHTLTCHAKRQSGREIEIRQGRLNAFAHFLCEQFIQQSEGEEEQTNG